MISINFTTNFLSWWKYPRTRLCCRGLLSCIMMLLPELYLMQKIWESICLGSLIDVIKKISQEKKSNNWIWCNFFVKTLILIFNLRILNSIFKIVDFYTKKKLSEFITQNIDWHDKYFDFLRKIQLIVHFNIKCWK